MRRFILPFAAAMLLAAGCQTAASSNSIAFIGFPCNVTRAPLAGDFQKCSDLKNLKKGTSSEVIYFQFFEPIVSAGDEAIRSAMRNGGLRECYFADYSARFFLIIGWYTVTAYGK